MKKEPLFILFIIILLGFMLRFWQLAQIPEILNRDEAALAYNALLLKETGKDEWSRSWPVTLQSFGDYKLIGYPLTTIISFIFFGYTDWAVKLPSALAGIILILLSYIFARKVGGWSERNALLLSFLVCVQPIFFFYSRIAFEANLGLTVLIASLICYFRSSFDKEEPFTKMARDILATVLLVFAIFTYNTPLLLLPFILPLFIWWRGVRKIKEWLPGAAQITLVLFVGVVTLLSASKQKSGITIFSDEDTWLASVQRYEKYSGVQQKIFGNKVVFYTQIILTNYVKTISPQFLVEKGGAHPWHSLPGWGHIFWTSYLLAIGGIVGSLFEVLRSLRHPSQLWKNRELRFKVLGLYLLCISPLPAVVTVDAPHATRSLLFFFIWLICSIWGVVYVEQLVKWASIKMNKRVRPQKIALVILLLVISGQIIESSNYFSHYFQDYQNQSNAILRGNYLPAVREVTDDARVPKAAIIDDGGYQYILTAWYLKMAPQTFFETIQKHLPDKIGFEYGYRVGKFRFIKQPTDRFEYEKTLIEWNPEEAKWKRINL